MRMSMSLRRRGWLVPPALLLLFLLLAPVASAGTPLPPRFNTPIEVENPPPSETVIVIGLGWSGSPNPEPLPRETTTSPTVAASIPYLDSTFDNWMRGNAPESLPGWQFLDAGEFMIPPPQPDFEPQCFGSQKAFQAYLTGETWRLLREQGRTEKEIVQFPYFIFYLSQPICGQTGIQYSVENQIVMGSLPNQRDLYYDFGRSFLFSDAGLLHCTAAESPVPLSSSCSYEARGDEYDVMGDGVGAFSAGEAYQKGWLNGQFFLASEGLGSHTFTIKPYSELPHGARAIRLTDNGQTFWIEYRAAVGIDNQAVDPLGVRVTPGLIVHRMGPSDQYFFDQRTELIDMTPSSVAPLESARNSGLPVGQTWADPLGTMKVTLNSVSAAGATVTISSQQSAAPNVLGSLVPDARATIEKAGFVYGGAEAVNDPTCTSVNRVTRQTPAAGTALFPGSSISITYGVKAPKQKCL